MKVFDTELSGVRIVEPAVYRDARGYFVETFHQERYRRLLGIRQSFVQDNHSRSDHAVLRGLHRQVKYPQGKLVRVVRGEVYDVAADVDPRSPHFGSWAGVVLSEANQRQLWIPSGYAHGFVVLSDVADLEYKCTEYYRPEDEGGVLWNDPELAIDWPIAQPKLSSKDLLLPTLAMLRH